MRICVVGAGAIGAYVGASLARGGAEVSVVARGAHLEAMRARGIAVRSPRGDFHAAVTATGDATEIGPVDGVIIALKAHQIAGMLPSIRTLLRPDTRVVAMQNGIPWWYFQGVGGRLEGLALSSVDPGGAIAAAIEPARIVGCVIYTTAAVVAPGVIEHVEHTRFVLGRPDGADDPAVEAIAAAFEAGGLNAPIERDLRAQLWMKLCGNVPFNPLSALTRGTVADVLADAASEALVRTLMDECIAVATALGIHFPVTIDERLAAARKVGAHKTSMLQDLEAGRALELDCITGALVELGAVLGVPTPAIGIVDTLARRLDANLRRAPAASETFRPESASTGGPANVR